MEDLIFEGWKPVKNVQCYGIVKRLANNKKNEGKAGVARVNSVRFIDEMWILDSGASKTITSHREDFYEYTKYKAGETLYSYTNANSNV